MILCLPKFFSLKRAVGQMSFFKLCPFKPTFPAVGYCLRKLVSRGFKLFLTSWPSLKVFTHTNYYAPTFQDTLLFQSYCHCHLLQACMHCAACSQFWPLGILSNVWACVGVTKQRKMKHSSTVQQTGLPLIKCNTGRQFRHAPDITESKAG